jgi:hypothetical protein
MASAGRPALVVALVAVGWGQGLARAQLKDCRTFDPPRAVSYTMFLDDIVRTEHATTPTDADQASLGALIAQAHAAFHRVRPDAQAPSAEWRTCAGRTPKLGDFALQVRTELFQNGVVLEVFGDSDGHRMTLKHAIIPLMYDQRAEILQLDSVPLTHDVDDAGAAIDRYRAHLQGYMEVAMGLRLILAVGMTPSQQRQRQTAQRWLCDGVRLIFTAGGATSKGPTADRKVLLDTISRYMEQIAASSAYDPVRPLLSHGPRDSPVDAVSAIMGACLGTSS